MSQIQELTALVQMFNTEGWQTYMVAKFRKDREKLIQLMVYGGGADNKAAAECIQYLDRMLGLEETVREMLRKIQLHESDPDAPADPGVPKVREPIDFSDAP